MKEIWKDIPNYEGLYQSSNLGRIRNVNTNRILKQQVDHDGYFIITLRKGKAKRTYKVHRLVAKTFMPGNHKTLQVNHISGIKSDNSVSNLEWVTLKENIKHAYKIGIYSSEQHSKAQNKSKKPVLKLKNGIIIKRYDSLKQASKENNVTKQSIYHAIKKQRDCVGYQWKYE